MKLFPFQEEAVAFHVKHKYTLNCSEMGLGKTVMALGAVKTVNTDVTVFCPAFLKPTWEREAKAMGVKAKVYSYTLMNRVTDLSDFWIADEIHYLKNPSAHRTSQFYTMLKERRPEYLIGLTGTPIKNRLPDFWTLLAFMSQCRTNINGVHLDGEMQRYYTFCRYFCKTNRMTVKGATFEKFGGIKPDKVGELKALLKSKYIRFRVADVLPELPEMTRKLVHLKMRSSPDEVMQATFDAYINGSKVDISGKVRSATLKSELTSLYARELLDAGEQVVIFTDHVEAARRIKLEIAGSEVVNGGTKMSDRQKIVDRFQAGSLRAIVATIGSFSTGITLHSGRHVIFNDLSWIPSENAQAEKRIHRIGQKNACVSHIMIANETDEYILRVLSEKMETIEKVMNG